MSSAAHAIEAKNGGYLIPFSKENPPSNPGRTKGARNRRTIVAEWLNMRTLAPNPDGESTLLSQADQIALKMIEKAKAGDCNAAYFVFDSAYGKIANVTRDETLPKQAFDPTKLTTDELLILSKLMSKGSTDNNAHIDEAIIVP